MNVRYITVGGVALLLALAVTLTFVVVAQSSPLSKVIAAGGITVAVLGAIKTLLDIVKLQEENAILREERSRTAGPVHLASPEDVDRYVVEPRRAALSNLPKSAAMGLLLLFIGGASWAAVMIHEEREDNRRIEELQKSIQALQKQIASDNSRTTAPGTSSTAASQPPPRNTPTAPAKDAPSRRSPQASTGVAERPSKAPVKPRGGTTPMPAVPTSPSPTLVIRNEYKSAELEVTVSGPTSTKLILQPGQSSGVIRLIEGDYEITYSVKNRSPILPNKFVAEQYGKYAFTKGDRDQ